MAGLSDFMTSTATESTSMPTWYDSAQQNIVNQATNAVGNMPTLQNTVAGQAINNLSGSNNPFLNAQGSLNTIAQGAANPWITGANGVVTPNTNTAMGGLFAAQNQQLNQLLPGAIAPVQGANIGGGNFGSLRGMTAVNKAKGDAFANLNAAQMQAALQNQATGVNAATGLGSVGSQGTQSMTALGQAQQSDPFTASSNLGKVVGGIKSPTTVTNATQLSPLQQIAALTAALPGTEAGINKIFDTLGIGDLKSLIGRITSGSSSPVFDYSKSPWSNIAYNPDGSVTNSTVSPDYGTTGPGADTNDAGQVNDSGQGIY
jgi:hypothetical protein